MDTPTTPSAATRQVTQALTAEDANNARIRTQKGAGWGFVTTVEPEPARIWPIGARLSSALGVRVEVTNSHVFVYWNQPA